MAHETYPTNLPWGSLLQDGINDLLTGIDKISRAHAIADEIRNGAVPANDALLESSSATQVPAGKGDEVWTLLNSIKGELDGLTAAWIASLDQGG